MSRLKSGAQIVLQALIDQKVDTIFGYPGGAVLPIYDELFSSEDIRHILVRHEQGAVHAAEGYARASGKPGVLLVTSGPGVTNTITGLADAMMDSTPLVCITGQVPTPLIGTDAFQEADTVGITRPCTKHNWLVRSVDDLPRILHQAFHIATSGRPGPVVVDIPKDVQFAKGNYRRPTPEMLKCYQPQLKGDETAIEEAVDLMLSARRPIFYTGGGVINSGGRACTLLRELVQMSGYPITSTLMGLGAYPASDPQWLGMVGMHGNWEANHAMHKCDVMINIGARFDDRVTGRLDAFSPHSKKIHVDIDPSSINKNVRVDVPVVGDCANILEVMIKVWKDKAVRPSGSHEVEDWWAQIEQWRARKCLAYQDSGNVIKPQYALERLYALTANRRDVYISTEVGQHQMWAAQYYHFQEPRHWVTSGGLGTMGFGLPAAIGMQIAHPDKLVVDVAGEASALMTIQEMSTAVQYNLPIKIFILNNQYMGMVRQWQELIHGGRYSHSYSESLPDFVALAQAFGAHGIRAENKAELDSKIEEMIEIDKPVLFDCRVDPHENCFPMIPSGAGHSEMLLSADPDERTAVSKEDKTLV
ncbi:MAG: acetolactate synthase 3 large subunit [Hyphomicrobiales bacterium]|nr:acetolactate synthase 3 large subunit [Hyphomicrobiales bacterium]